jgi:hypothetical protein
MDSDLFWHTFASVICDKYLDNEQDDEKRPSEEVGALGVNFLFQTISVADPRDHFQVTAWVPVTI